MPGFEREHHMEKATHDWLALIQDVFQKRKRSRKIRLVFSSTSISPEG